MAVAQIRKKPAQARSRARYEAILGAAKELIVRKGSDALKMSEIAARAQVPIGSVYQFFPGKSGIIATLAHDYMEDVRAGLMKEAGAIKSRADAEAAIGRLMDDYYAFFLTEPVARDIWCGTQADKRLQDMDIEDSRLNGEIFYRALKPLTPKPAWKDLRITCFLMMQLTGAAVRMAIVLDRREAKRIIAAYKNILRAQLLGALDA